ncbi:MAG: type II toxin-antitoxin system RelE/ParE family toxin [Gemmatimonadetes bacterium]|nr:type II toxin-antitoxin system RelE/ParE family toxin [Gemmatimonadota bacterium]
MAPPHARWIEFVYSDFYERFVKGSLSDEVERAFEQTIAANPLAGRVIPRGGGVRKVRVALQGTGKRGGARFIYFLRLRSDRVYVLAAFAKNTQRDLTPSQLRVIRDLLSTVE